MNKLLLSTAILASCAGAAQAQYYNPMTQVPGIPYYHPYVAPPVQTYIPPPVPTYHPPILLQPNGIGGYGSTPGYNVPNIQVMPPLTGLNGR